MNIYGEYGFFLNHEWCPNTWRGHEGNAFYLIEKNGWLEEWKKSKRTAQDFIVLRKGAIQLGANGNPKVIQVSEKCSELFLRSFMGKYGLSDYQVEKLYE